MLSPKIPLLMLAVGLALTTAVKTPMALAAPRVSTASTLALGEYHSCAVFHGVTRCWGDNRDGQLGDGSGTWQHIPVIISGLTSGIVSISAGLYHTCALTGLGGVKCWGHNSFGQGGNGTIFHQQTPVDVIGLTNNISAIAAGAFHTCALTNSGGVKCWGLNNAGQLGNGSQTNQATPVDVSGLASDVIAISAGDVHSCALMSAGTIKCWGDDTYGQLGDGTFGNGNFHASSVDVVGLSNINSVSAGGSFTCAVSTTGGAQCWGFNGYGEIGDGTTIEQHSPTDVVGLTNGVSTIATGLTHACALLDSGGVKCWGNNSSGQLGDDTNLNHATPISVIGLTSGTLALAAGDQHTCAQTNDRLLCWGRNLFGELGDGSYLFRTSLVSVSTPDMLISITTGANHTCALTNAGGTRCWGLNWYGNLGDSTTSQHPTPIHVVGLETGTAAVAAGFGYTCALLVGGNIKCWGLNNNGQLGDGTLLQHLSPVDVVGLGTSAEAISSGYSHTCALTTGGGMKCWGDNEYGQLGDGTTTDRATPVNVSGLTSAVIAISTGTSFTCAVVQSGAAKCWGRNSSGQLGDGTLNAHSTPMDVAGLTSGVAMISTGWTHACTVMTNGSAKCWGYNGNGAIGNGTLSDSKTPVQIIGLSTGVSKISAGWAHTCALMTSGGAKCWGYNPNGAVGDGSSLTRSTPVDVLGLGANVSAISAGQNFSCATTTGNAARCWGFNYYGQLGDGEAGQRTAPIGVLWFQSYFPFTPK